MSRLTAEQILNLNILSNENSGDDSCDQSEEDCVEADLRADSDDEGDTDECDDEEENEEEEEEIPDEWKEMDPATRARAIIMMSCKMMLLGTAVVLIFSDPMVDVLNQVGIVTGVGSF